VSITLAAIMVDLMWICRNAQKLRKQDKARQRCICRSSLGLI
jgi:hypothetical protein